MQPTSTDTSLVERVQQGDHHAFAELVRRHDHRLRAVAQRLLRCPDRAEDALQDAYLKAFRHIGSIRRDATVATWLYRIVYNTCLDELRRRRFDTAADAELDQPARGRGPAEHAVAQIEAADVLGRLAPELRATVMVVHGYGYDYADASRILGVPVGTVSSRLQRARRRVEGVAADAA